MRGRPGVSQVALLVSVAFWTWLWGPLGLLMATPLTVCLVVLGKHVPGLEFVGTLMADTPALAPEYGYYQRLLARDQSEAADLIERHIKTEPPRSVYDALLLPALNYAERDRLEQRLSLEEETAVIDATRELLSDAAESIRRLQSGATRAAESTQPLPDRANRCACWATRPTASPTSSRSRCSRTSLDDLPIAVEMTTARMLASELVSLVQAHGRLGRLPRRSATQPAVEDALSRQEAPRRVARGANPGRALGAAGAGRREHAGAARCRRDARRRDAGGDPDVPGRARGSLGPDPEGLQPVK